jgi:hypothetical protein
LAEKLKNHDKDSEIAIETEMHPVYNILLLQRIRKSGNLITSFENYESTLLKKFHIQSGQGYPVTLVRFGRKEYARK